MKFMNDNELIDKIKKYDFYHDIQLKEGISTKSFKALNRLTNNENESPHWSQRRNFTYIDREKINFKNKSSIKSKNNTLLILAWNFFNEIKKNNSDISNNFVNIKDLED